jgi:hypothetical protein
VNTRHILFFVFPQPLIFTFSGSLEMVIIFNKIADWIAGIDLFEELAEPSRAYGGVLFVMACGAWLTSATFVERGLNSPIQRPHSIEKIKEPT